MYISKKQRAIINAAVKPFYITSNYLGAGLQNLLKFYSKYFAQLRYNIVHYSPTYKNYRHRHYLTVASNAFVRKGGYAKKRRPDTWTFYGNILLTKYGQKKQKQELKRRRKRARRQKKANNKKQQNAPNKSTHKLNDKECIIISESSTSNPNDVAKNPQNVDEKRCANEEVSKPADEIATDDTQKSDLSHENCSDSNAGKDDYDDETVDNIWNLDIQEVAALITESGNDDNQLSESGDFNDNADANAGDMDAVQPEADANVNDNAENSSCEDSISNQIHEDDQTNSTNDSTPNETGDINERLRQQLKLLKMGKSENSLFAPKETLKLCSTQNPRNVETVSRRSTLLTDSKRLLSSKNVSSTNESHFNAINPTKNVSSEQKTDDVQKSKSNGGIIDSLFNKFQSIGKTIPTRSQNKAISSPQMSATSTAAAAATPIPSKRLKRDEPPENLFNPFDAMHDDSNQSNNSISMEFLGFDISNKNVDVSALLPTPKVGSSSEQAAFVSELLDTFMKENSLEKSNDHNTYMPKRRRADEALMTTDAQPPNLSVPERPMDMQRPRTLAEKRMILQQHNDISLLIIENESTVYHELKKRVKQGAAYDNTLMRSIQDANIPFTRDCWRAACWISTSNNRFFYRTILYDGEEIKLIGSRGDNTKKVALELDNFDDHKSYTSRIPADCRKICTPITDIRINNIDMMLNDTKPKVNDSINTQGRLGLLRRSKCSMFSREYLTPGPKCAKVKCKSNRKSSFDLEYGPLELVQLPTVQLEVWPQVGLSLSDHVKSILKTIPPNSNVITSEWAKFAVSVVRETPKQIKHRRKYKKPEIEKPPAITFDIAYENNEKMILIRRRRRSAILFSQSDTKHEQIETFYQHSDSNQLTFTKHLDPSDTLSMECASILTNMIDSVAIAVNDTNFIKQDPDIDYVGKIVSLADKSKDTTKIASKNDKDKQSAKTEKPAKSKLMKELKRLNVTVIDTANEMIKTKRSDEICQRSSCKLGCVCESIDNAKHVQTHCQLYECMFSCKCTNTPFTETNPFNLNKSIDILQERANARLAKVEKEFKSTIVVSENDMFVLPNSSTATKRSSKKPKRFTNDETCVDDTETETIFNSKRRRPTEKLSPSTTITTPITTTTTTTTTTAKSTENWTYEYQQRHNLLKSLQHVRVNVKRLPELEVEPWCMIHCLYKCHCKGRAQRGRIFNFANKKNDLTGPGGWELITPRKRQYTFEREHHSTDEPLHKQVKLVTVAPSTSPSPSTSASASPPSSIGNVAHEQASTTARTTPFYWMLLPRRTAQELKTLRNECMFVEDQCTELLNKRVVMCRKYNQAQNMLTKTMENGRLALSNVKCNAIPNGSIQSVNKPTNVALQRLNHVITDTMHRLTALQERNQLTLNPTPNKLSIVPWDRILRAFISNDVYVWDVLLKDNLRLLVLTTTYSKPKSENFVEITNINYADINGLPMVAKLLRNEYRTDRTKYLAMVLLRMTQYWRICGVMHSDVKYMDDELRAKPTPDQNPLLGRKINTLYQLLTQITPRTTPIKSDGSGTITPIRELNDETSILSTLSSNDGTSVSMKGLLSIESVATADYTDASDSNANKDGDGNDKKDDDDDDDDNGIVEIKPLESVSYFENSSMRLSLPIPIAPNQRLLMINVGDDFTHVWFPSWHKFLSIKRIQNSFILCKQVGKAIEMSQSVNYPKVFVSHSHENCIFIGPYGNMDRQNLALFVKHDNHMMLSELYYKKFGDTYTKKTKASWIYPSSSNKNRPIKSLKISAVRSKLHGSIDGKDGKQTIQEKLAADEVSKSPPSNGHFAAISASNGVKTDCVESSGVLRPSSMIYVPTKIVELTGTTPATTASTINTTPIKPNNSNMWSTNTSPEFKITSVASGESVALMTNGMSIDDFTNSNDSQSSNEPNDLNGDDDDDMDVSLNAANRQPEMSDDQAIDIPNSLPIKNNETDHLMDADNEFGQILVQTKTEPIDISDDDEQTEYNCLSELNPIDCQTDDFHGKVNGYIYCQSNIQLGRVNVEWTSSTQIKLYLEQCVVIACDEKSFRLRHYEAAEMSKFMQTHIRNRFYGVYPAHLKLDWFFTQTETAELDVATLCDFNKVDPFSVVFRDKVVAIGSNYRDDSKLLVKEIYVVDIYLLASHLFSQEDVQKMKISEILAKSQQIDAELMDEQTKLKKAIAHYEHQTRRYRKRTSNQNGEC